MSGRMQITFRRVTEELTSTGTGTETVNSPMTATVISEKEGVTDTDTGGDKISKTMFDVKRRFI